MCTHFASSGFSLVFVCALLIHSAAAAEGEKFDCYALFIAADKDRNGVLERREDENGYLAALATRGVKTLNADAVSQTEFTAACENGVFDKSKAAAGTVGSTPPSPSQQDRDLPKDLGKGDITPGPQRFSEADARARLRANGFAEVDQLALDAQGVWRGTAVVNGKRVPVAVDGQGDIIGGP